MKIRENVKNIKPYIPGVLKPGAVKLASNENPLGVSRVVQKAVKEYLNNIALYPDGGCVELKKKLADKYQLKPENFIIGNGSDEIFLFIAGLLIEPGDEMITSECTFSEYTFSTLMYDGVPVYVPIKDGKYQLNEFLKRLTPKTKLIFIANPNNPTGTYLKQKELASFMEKISDNVLVVIDEAYCEYVDAKDYPDAIALQKQFKNLLITRTFSKIYGLAGLRIGYAVGDAGLIDNLNKTREPFNVNAVAQVAAIAALADGNFVTKSIRNNRKGKKYLYAEFDKLGLKYFKSAANFIYVEIGIDCLEAFQKLMDLGVTIRPMKSFGQDKAIRVTIGTPEQNELFIQCLKQIL
jgi:histidinol-phosphate aminotransferase